METTVIRLGAWCDLETGEEARRRLTEGADGGDPEPTEDGAGPRPGRYVPLPGTPVLSPGGLDFRVEEFAVLADGRRIRLHAERGFGLSAGANPWRYVTLESLADSVRATVLPDDAEDTGEEHPWDWLAVLLRGQGIPAAGADLRELPYDVEFSDRLRAQVSAGG